jgi:hypothetical protein
MQEHRHILALQVAYLSLEIVLWQIKHWNTDILHGSVNLK